MPMEVLYFIAGALERLGIRIDIALNLISSLGFFLLLMSIYTLSISIFKKKAAGLLAIFMVIFNASFSWIYYLTSWNLQLESIDQIVLNKRFAAFGPFDDNIISAFWNLNLYTNQRHAALALALMFFCVWILAYSKRRAWHIAAFVCVLIMPFLNQAVLLPLFLTLALAVVGAGKQRREVFIRLIMAIIFVLPVLLLVSGGANIRFDPGYLYDRTSWHEIAVSNNLVRWLIYWFLNLGLLPFFALAGFFLLKKLHFKNFPALL